MTLKLITPPSEEPITLAEAKAQCRIDSDETADDAFLQALIKAAREMAEHQTGRAFVTQTLELVLDGFHAAFVLRRPPTIAIESVKFLDSTGVQQTLNPVDTLLDNDSEPGYLVPAYGKTWPDSYPVPNAVRVRYTAGYGDRTKVPESIKQWMLLMIGTGYANRETVVQGQISTLGRQYWDALLDPYRLYEVA